MNAEELHASLNQALEDSYTPSDLPPEPTEGEERKPWTITDMGAAAWVSRKLKPNYERRAEIKAWAKAEINRIKEIEAAETKRLENDVSYLEHSLRMFLTRLLAEGRKTKSLDLPGGTFKLTKRQPEITYDEAEVIKFAQENGLDELIRIKTELDKDALKKSLNFDTEGTLITKDGIIIPGSWAAQPDNHSFSPATVKTNTEEAN